MMERGAGQREKQKAGSAGSLQELVAQYKTALRELTFNSKPIITNLTIIAGESAHAAAAVAATVCDHILEVPNEQKLPSLYLLDSIVKNIGGDYVKHFAARLAEVFCTSYRQVDPSTYAAMRHLFRTWRGVFPGAPLRIIETELLFPPLTNGPSLTTNSSKSVESPQHPGHSIHVNPKYLEAQKQRLQQSTRADETVSTEINEESRICEDELPERVVLDSEKSWPDGPKRAPPLPRIRDDGFAIESGYVRKVPLSFLDYDYSSSDRGLDIERRVVDREEIMDRGWLREGEDAFRMTESGSGNFYNQRNGYELRQLSPRSLVDAYGNGRAPRAPRIPPPPPPAPAQPVLDVGNSRGLSRNWQNSEEEYSWENISHRLSEHGQLREGMRKEAWLLGDADKKIIPGWFGRGKPLGLDQQLSDVDWRRFGPMPLTDRPLSAERKLSLHRAAGERVPRSLSILQQDIGASTVSNGLDVPALGANLHSVLGQRSLASRLAHHLPQQLSPPAQSRLRSLPLVTDPNRTPPLSTVGSVLSQSVNISTPFSTSGVTSIIGSSVTIQESTRPAMGSLYGGGLLNFGSLSSVSPASSLASQQRKPPQRPLSPTMLALPSQPRLPPVPNSSLLQPNFQPSQHQRVNGLKPVHQAPEMLRLQQNASFHMLEQQQPVQLHPHVQVVQKPAEQLEPLQQFVKPLSIPLSQPTSEQQLVPQQTMPALPHLPTPQLLHSLQQLQHHLPPHIGSSMRQSQASQSSQQLQVPPLPIQQVQLSQLQLLQPPSQNHMPPQPEQSPQLPQDPGYVAPPMGTPMNGNSSSSGSQGHSNANNLLAAFLQSGIVPPSQALQMFPHLRPSTPPNISTGPTESTIPAEVSSQLQPPLPSGPPPIQLPISGVGSTLTQPALSLPPAAVTLMPRPLSLQTGLSSNLPAFAFQPPLPPGPPPVSSQLVTSVTQSLTSVGRQPPVTNLSTLFSSLMAQGLISTSSSSATAVLPQTGTVVSNSNNTTVAVAFPKSNLGLVSSVAPLVPVVGSFMSAVATVPATLVTALRTQSEVGRTDNPSDQTSSSVDCIGTEFKQEILRERHESVIKALYIDFPRQCKTCGLRFKLQEEHSKHMDWHVSRNRQLKSSKKISRKWFASIKEWLGGIGSSASEVSPSFLPEDVPVKLEEHERVAVPADENQSACALCGEPFEDFYSDETEEWMYKGAVYMNAPPGSVNEGVDSSLWGPIVHAKCRSLSAATGAVDSAEEDAGEEDDDLGRRRKKMRY